MRIIVGKVISHDGKKYTVSHQNKNLSARTLKFIRIDEYTCISYDNIEEEFVGISLSSSNILQTIESEYYRDSMQHFDIGDCAILKFGSPNLFIEKINVENEKKLLVSWLTINGVKKTREILDHCLNCC